MSSQGLDEDENISSLAESAFQKKNVSLDWKILSKEVGENIGK